jgi:formate-dependent nitrite reductase membrane component NrfD
MMTPEPYFQADIARWAWAIAWFLWFSGIAGMSSLAYFFVRRAPLAYLIFGSLAIGTLLVVSNMTRWWNLPVVFFNTLLYWTMNWGSWMMIGVALLSLHLLLALILVGAHLGFSDRRGLRWTRVLQQNSVFLGAFAFLGVMVTVYTGFLLTQAAGIPLWNTALIPVLWVISGAVTAVAVLELFSLLGWVDEKESVLSARIGLGLDAAKLLGVLAFLHVSLVVGTAGARLGAAEMVWGQYALMTWLGVIGIGILIPLAIGVYTTFKGKRRRLIFVSSVAALAGALILRAVVLLAGTFEPLA